MPTPSKPRIMFLCTGNSCRSQMAEGWARHLLGDRFEFVSAGTDPKGLDPLAVKAMAEVGIDISGHTSKAIAQCDPDTLDLVITVCDDAAEHCPAVSMPVRVVHQGFPDPPRLAAGATSEHEALEHYRAVRDQIGRFVGTIPALFPQGRTR
ncbi:MAG: arsenate reductase [Phycisphaerales bacterium]|nr:MAG: arsenate reductase [Phycisphaerales bacterium]